MSIDSSPKILERLPRLIVDDEEVRILLVVGGLLAEGVEGTLTSSNPVPEGRYLDEIPVGVAW